MFIIYVLVFAIVLQIGIDPSIIHDSIKAVQKIYRTIKPRPLMVFMENCKRTN